ncbi:MAG: shikimate dehydrogenase [Clostridiales Family XIII bacterium]|jgi:shikimate 5-dehydrogenase|nr:shikimate dehydrogenase [Clostridiales Family XIII bacterium]
MFDFSPATKPTMYFIGVTTSKSSIMNVFPKWAEALGLGDVEIKGIDLPLHAPVEDYRKVAQFLKEDPLSEGALVTTHKLDLYQACKDMFDEADPYALQLQEISSISKQDGRFIAHAKDPISSGLALEQFVPANFWKEHGGEALLLGAGGSSLAMSIYFGQEKSEGNAGQGKGDDGSGQKKAESNPGQCSWGDNVPKAITIANRSTPRLDSARETLQGLNPKIELRFLHSPTPADNDKLIASLPPYSLIVNATGLGKDAPGSPTTDAVSYPEHALVWEINYRGDLIFKEQAERQAAAKRLHIEDGWDYFIFGWTQVIAEVFHVEIQGETLRKLSEIAKKI